MTSAPSRAARVAGAAAAADSDTVTGWLEAVARALETHATELVEIAEAETRLGLPRLTGELAKAAANARYYAAAGAGTRIQVAEHVDGTGDLVRGRLPLGPVAVFGASNFPFQFGSLGHDTCSAIAAGCPVVVKAHPAHPRLAARLLEVATDALTVAGAPDGLLGQVEGFDAGLALVGADEIAAVGFTGSQAGGMALVERAAQRRTPIPVFAEMGTVNPVVVTPAASDRIAEISAGFVDSFTLGTGQFCTKPGLLLAPAGVGFAEAIAAEVRSRSGTALLTPGIATAWESGTSALVAAGATPLAVGRTSDLVDSATPVVLTVTAEQLVAGSRLLEECFGPVALVCEYDSLEQAMDVARRLQPALAAAVWSGLHEDPDTARLVGVLGTQVGRVIVDGWPTGVACADAMQHGGPWPATSRPDATSVGAAALQRWTRPVAFQNVARGDLPAALREHEA